MKHSFRTFPKLNYSLPILFCCHKVQMRHLGDRVTYRFVEEPFRSFPAMQRPGPDTRVLRQDENIARQAIADGAHDYITKPTDLDYLESSVMVKMTDILG